MKRSLTTFALILALAASGLSCVFFKNDRCAVSPERYEQATRLYELVGSLNLVRSTLRGEGWPACEVREIEYRLTKEYHLDTPYEPRREDK